MAGSNEFTFFTRERTVVYHEVHGNGRFVDGDEGQLFYAVGRTYRFAYVDLFETRNRNDVAHFGVGYFHTFKPLELIQFAYARVGRGLVGVNYRYALSVADLAADYSAYADTSDVFVVIDVADYRL